MVIELSLNKSGRVKGQPSTDFSVLIPLLEDKDSKPITECNLHFHISNRNNNNAFEDPVGFGTSEHVGLLSATVLCCKLCYIYKTIV